MQHLRSCNSEHINFEQRRSSLKGQERASQSDKHWNCFKGNVGNTSERQGGGHMGFPERIDTILNSTEPINKLARRRSMESSRPTWILPFWVRPYRMWRESSILSWTSGSETVKEMESSSSQPWSTCLEPHLLQIWTKKNFSERLEDNSTGIITYVYDWKNIIIPRMMSLSNLVSKVMLKL